MQKRNLPLLENVEIVSAGAEGKAIARVNNKVIFVPFVVPGDVVDIQIKKKKKSFEEGVAVRFEKYSDKRIEPLCAHFGLCGGCKWQNMQYEDQLFYKQQQVVDNFSRIGHLDFEKIDKIIPSKKQFYYRNKLEFSFNNRRWLNDVSWDQKNLQNADGLGFHLPGMWDRILDIDYCYLQKEPSNEIRLAIKEYAVANNLSFYDQRAKQGFLRNLVIRNTVDDQWMILMIFGSETKKERENLLDFILEKFPKIASLSYAVNEKTNDIYLDLDFVPYKRDDHVMETMEHLKFRVGPTSFYQTNHGQALILYRIARDFAALTGDEVVYDLYTGTGTIANFVAHQAKKVVGIEYIEDAVKDARINSEINNITNTVFYAGDMAKVLTEDFIAKNSVPDVVITDPPRAGMHEKVIRQMMKAAPRRIVYVSCNPATQARDLALMSDFYEITKIQPVDMFPHTHHVENVTALEKR
ncbi:MAG: 23S rRNA (uracil(1939)-C(5))-methyltransferase RlmD [Bacteroidales bacterium]|jgi:23S rRNA (uracil1939-C5)-methyltransferase|nr:23S rRNA (uracil(1939)-C(5))-methyltransferase RlmD [Bacteroidales bacterium]